ncbi:hypothetical protein HDV05_002297, partial [Chytridiales sp. JEL 0842]
ISDEAAVASALVEAGGPKWLGVLLSFGALCGLTSVMMVSLVGQPRIFRAMAYDGLFPEIFAYIHPKTQAPVVTTLISGTVSAVAGAFLPIDILANLTSVGTLLAFGLVAGAVIILRIREPHRERPFDLGRIFGFLVPITSIAFIIILFYFGGSAPTFLRVSVWLALGVVVYFCYGFWWSKLRHPEKWGISREVQQVAVEVGKKV